MKLVALVLVLWSTSVIADWTYTSWADPMGGTMTAAEVISRNTVEFSSPYGRPQRAALVLRVHDRRGRDAYVTIERGQFLCRVDGCSLSVRFDDKPAMQFAAVSPEDHSTTTLFIRDYSRFLSQVRKASVVRVEAPFFQQGRRVLEFDVKGLAFDAHVDRERRSIERARADVCSEEAGNRGLAGAERSGFIARCTKTGWFK